MTVADSPTIKETTTDTRIVVQKPIKPIYRYDTWYRPNISMLQKKYCSHCHTVSYIIVMCVACMVSTHSEHTKTTRTKQV